MTEDTSPAMRRTKPAVQAGSAEIELSLRTGAELRLARNPGQGRSGRRFSRACARTLIGKRVRFLDLGARVVE
jgi:hypothetical protein